MSVATETKVIDQLLHVMIEKRASDLHLAVGSPPTLRIDGRLMPEQRAALDNATIQEMVSQIVDAAQWERFQKEKELDFSYSIAGLSRFRGNLLRQRKTVGAVLRAIPHKPLSLDELGFPNLKEITARPRGLILVTGPTGSGKSTTLAGIIDHINETRSAHIVTIEDPIEFAHRNKKSLIHQREVGTDTAAFSEALRHVVRQDPDVILVGEMRDLETISLAITAAEMGSLVFGTLHTTGAAQTVDRIVDVFPPHQQAQIRMQLSGTLEAVISQTLVPKQNEKGRVCAMEIMVGVGAVKNLIREGKTQQLASMIQTGAKVGMQSLDFALKKLVEDGAVKYEDALIKSSNFEEFKRVMGKN